MEELLLKAGGVVMICRLHVVLAAVWQSDTIPPDWKREHVILIWKEKGDSEDCNSYLSILLLSVPGTVLASLLHMHIYSQLLYGFMPGKSTTDQFLLSVLGVLATQV